MIKNSRHPGEGRDPFILQRKRPNGFRIAIAAAILSGMTMQLAIPQDKAPEPASNPSNYAPDFCEFTVTFPAAPYTSQRCDEAGKRCYEQISYTQVFDMASTVNFRVICNPVDASVIGNYSAEVMAATLRAMTNRSVVKTFDITQREEKEYKQAGLVGEGQAGKLPTIYIAQLWIGKRSALSVEAELIGEPSEKADRLFSGILKSIGYRPETTDNAAPPSQPEGETKQSTPE